jgi:hypothetical protein
MNAIEQDAEFRRFAFNSILKADPELETDWLASHGVRTIPAKNYAEIDNKEVEEEYNTTDEEWEHEEH